MRCPDCRLPLDLASLQCACGRTFTTTNGVLSLLSTDFAAHLADFLPALRRARDGEGRRLVANPAAYCLLPDGPLATGVEWRLRRYDLATVLALLPTTPHRILDIGAWNGWLSHNLARRGHLVTAVDYFDDPYDGLGACAAYDSAFRAVQMDLTDLTVLNERFDLVILNRCLQFFPNPAAYLSHARARLAPSGRLLLLGLQFFARPAAKARAVAADLRHHRQLYGFELFLRPTRGYLDLSDRRALTAQGVKLHPYPQLRLANLKARLLPHLPYHAYGLLHEHPTR